MAGYKPLFQGERGPISHELFLAQSEKLKVGYLGVTGELHVSDLRSKTRDRQI